MTREEYRAQKAARERMRQMEQKHKQAARGSMDLPFLILTVLLTVVGLIMLFSASFPRAYYDTGDGTYYFKRQALFAAVGMAAMFVIAKINYQRWRGASRMLVGLALFLLILVIIPHNPLAITANNATRWLGIKGVFQFQPSEIAKLAVIVYFADTISKKKEKMLTWRQGILPYVALLGVISVLMMLEPHLSGTVLILCTGAVLMIVGGIQGWLVGAGVGGVAALGFLFIRLAERVSSSTARPASPCGTTRGWTTPATAISWHRASSPSAPAACWAWASAAAARSSCTCRSSTTTSFSPWCVRSWGLSAPASSC